MGQCGGKRMVAEGKAAVAFISMNGKTRVRVHVSVRRRFVLMNESFERGNSVGDTDTERP